MKSPSTLRGFYHCEPGYAVGMYDFILILHNLLRWLILLGAVWVLLVSVRGLQTRVYAGSDRTAGRVFVSLMDIQLLIGVILYFVSPLIQGSLANFGVAVQASQTRFFLLEHTVVMIVGVALAHVGNVRIRRSTEAAAKHRQALIWYGLSLLAVLLAIPWWRPLLRF
mgnify:CR=1 FL=1